MARQQRGDILLGCDGIHSVTRLKHVEPERTAVYSGVSNAFGFSPVPDGVTLHFECAALNFCQRGMMLTSFHEPTHKSVYVGGLMEVPEIGRQEWLESSRRWTRRRSKPTSSPVSKVLLCLRLCLLFDAAEDFYLWPVFTLSKGGQWATERVMLLGDAAHAMPPQGESTGIVFEDTVLFARCLSRWIELGKPGKIKDAFDIYEKLRRQPYRCSIRRVAKCRQGQSKMQAGWGHRIKMFIVPWYLWWTKGYRDQHFIEDVTTSDLGF